MQRVVAPKCLTTMQFDAVEHVEIAEMKENNKIGKKQDATVWPWAYPNSHSNISFFVSRKAFGESGLWGELPVGRPMLACCGNRNPHLKLLKAEVE